MVITNILILTVRGPALEVKICHLKYIPAVRDESDQCTARQFYAGFLFVDFFKGSSNVSLHQL